MTALWPHLGLAIQHSRGIRWGAERWGACPGREMREIAREYGVCRIIHIKSPIVFWADSAPDRSVAEGRQAWVRGRVVGVCAGGRRRSGYAGEQAAAGARTTPPGAALAHDEYCTEGRTQFPLVGHFAGVHIPLSDRMLRRVSDTGTRGLKSMVNPPPRAIVRAIVRATARAIAGLRKVLRRGWLRYGGHGLACHCANHVACHYANSYMY